MDRQDQKDSGRGGQGAPNLRPTRFRALSDQPRWTVIPLEPHNAMRKGTVRSKSDDRAETTNERPRPNSNDRPFGRSPRRSGLKERERSPRDLRDNISSPEIAQLVSAALENALLATGSDDPGEFLQLRAVDGRREMRQMMRSVPALQAECPTFQAEYRKAVLFQNVALDLAFEIMHAIDRYARAVHVADEPRDS